jgi:hypothetical protein
MPIILPVIILPLKRGWIVTEFLTLRDAWQYLECLPYFLIAIDPSGGRHVDYQLASFPSSVPSHFLSRLLS